jgi:hypothetical protein
MSQPAVSPPTVFLNLVLIFLTPMFLWAADGDLDLARQAALETLDAYRARTAISLITAARLIAFELACLASLSQSMADDITPQLALRFRSNANTLDRAAERNRAALERQHIPAAAEHLTEERAAAAVAEAQQRVQQAVATLQAATPPTEICPVQLATAPVPLAQPPAAAQRPAQPAPTQAATPSPTQPSATSASPPRPGEQQRRTAWAQAMTSVAAEFTAGLDRLPPAERAKDMMHINLLTESASALVSGIAPSDHPGNLPVAGLAAPAGASAAR